MKRQTTTNAKPRCKLTGTDGNIFALGARAGETLRRYGKENKVEEMQHRICQSKSYDEALQVITEYVDVY